MEKLKQKREFALWGMGLLWMIFGVAALAYEYPYEQMYLGMFTLVFSIAPLFLLIFHLRDRRKRTV